jgi:hypothetical protein
MLRGSAGIDPKLHLQVTDGPLPVTQEFENPHTNRMAEDAEELGLDDVNGFGAGAGHEDQNTYIS